MEEVKKYKIPEAVSIRELAEIVGLPASQIISTLIKYGLSVTINESIDFETINIISDDLGFQVEKEEKEKILPSVSDIIRQEKPKDLKERPPIVTIMGHVDHGKTSLLDAIRETSVAEKEAGLITQHIGAYQVDLSADRHGKKGKKITFIDTPGHEAFVAIRARGALITDIAVLVIDASDSIRPQSLEAINHARGANVPIIVAITKIDKPEANIEKIKKELSKVGLTCEDCGGKTICVPVSSKTKEGIDDLLEMIVLVAEMAELKANPEGKTVGTVIESHIKSGKGPVATVLVQNGTLRVGDSIVCGRIFGRIKSMEDFKGKKVKEALPSTPVKISGLKETPIVGDILYLVGSEKEAKEIISTLKKTEKAKKIAQPEVKKIESTEEESEVLKFKIILKADVVGSLEALHSSLLAMGNEKVRVEIIAEGIGNISESDVMMAEVTGAKIYGFNISIDEGAKKATKVKKVKILTFNIIYDLIDEVHKELEALLPLEIVEESLGELEVLEIFRKGKGEMIVGGKVKKGKILNKSQVKIIRSGEFIGQGKITNLQVQKKDTTEASVGQECGMLIVTEFDIKKGDKIESYKIEEKPVRL